MNFKKCLVGVLVFAMSGDRLWGADGSSGQKIFEHAVRPSLGKPRRRPSEKQPFYLYGEGGEEQGSRQLMKDQSREDHSAGSVSDSESDIEVHYQIFQG